MQKELIKDFIFKEYQGGLKDFVDSHCDMWMWQNNVECHTENGELQGVIMYHSVTPETVQVDGAFVNSAAGNRIFFKLFRKAIRGKKYVIAACQKTNAKAIKFLTCISHEIVDQDDFNMRFKMTRNCIKGV